MDEVTRTILDKEVIDMRIMYGILAGLLWAILMIYLTAKTGITMPDNEIQILSIAIIVAGAMAGGD